jgi:DNA polymerase III gamma/tau subunit
MENAQNIAVADEAITGEVMPAADFQNEIARIGVTDAALAELRSRYGKVKKIATKADYKYVLSGIGVLRKHRTSLDKLRLHLNSDDRARIEARNSEAKRITAEIVAIEEPLKELKLAEDARIAAEKAEAEAKEKSRIDDIRALMMENFGPSVIHHSASIDELRDAIRKMECIAVDPDDFHEFADEAAEMQRLALASLNETLTTAIAREHEERERAEENARIKAEQEAEAKALEEQRQEIARQQAEIAAEQAAKAAELKEEQEKQAAAMKKQQDEMAAQQARLDAQQKAIDDEKQAQADAALEAEEAETARIEAARVAAEAAEQAERDRIAKEEADKARAVRQEALRPDKEKVLVLADELMDQAVVIEAAAKAMEQNFCADVLYSAGDTLRCLIDDMRESCETI